MNTFASTQNSPGLLKNSYDQDVKSKAMLSAIKNRKKKKAY